MKKMVIGVIIMMLGAFLLLNNMGFFIPEVYHIIISWQALLIAIGATLLFDRPADHKNAGIVLIFIGALFLMPKMFDVSLGGIIIPSLIMAAGVGFIVRAVTRKNSSDDCDKQHSNEWKHYYKDFDKKSTISVGGVVKKDYVFTGAKEKWTHGKLKNVEIDAVFSGVELDLTQAELAEDVKVAVHIKVSSVFSGVTLYVPEDWNIVIQKTGVFGNFDDKRTNNSLQSKSDKLVILELEAVFGGGEIRCYE